nr:MAG TPA: hypothetical protein [Caudoviricetes sp.]
MLFVIVKKYSYICAIVLKSRCNLVLYCDAKIIRKLAINKKHSNKYYYLYIY